jgi:hypothetical protein
MIVVKECPAEFGTPEEVAESVETWVASVPDHYRLNQEFERFKATLRRLETEGDPGMSDNPDRRPFG